MTAQDMAYLEEFIREARGEYSKTPMRIPPGVRWLFATALQVDGMVRHLDAQGPQLHAMLSRTTNEQR